MKYRLITFSILLFCVCSSHIAAAQTTDTSSYPRLFWIGGGGGVAGPGVGGFFRACYAWGPQSISAKVAAGTTFDIFSDKPHSSFTDYSMFYGRQTTDKWTMARIAVGPTYIVREFFGTTTQRLGIGIEAEAMLKVYVFGLGVTASAIYAPDIPLFGAIMLELNFGKLADF